MHCTSALLDMAEGGIHTYVRRDSSSSNLVAHDDYDTPPLPREPSFDDDGHLLSHSEDEDVFASHPCFEESSTNSLDEHSNIDRSVDDSFSDNDISCYQLLFRLSTLILSHYDLSILMSHDTCMIIDL